MSRGPNLPDVIPVYTSQRGRLAHLLPGHASPNNPYERALCGVPAGDPRGWWGTGTQDEHERAATLPVCINCERKRRHR